MHNLKIGLEVIITSLIAVFLPIIAVTLITSRTDLGGFQSFTVLSGSMEPLIPTGSIVYTFKTDDIKPGDVITFKRENINITHRVIEVVDKDGKNLSNYISPVPSNVRPKEIFYRTRGDNNSSVDTNLVAHSSLVGETLVHLPYAGKLFFFLKTFQGFLVLVILPTLIFVLIELWKIKGEIEKSIERKTIERLSKSAL